MDATKPRIAIVLGDPAGIGPELVAKLLADPETQQLAEILLVTDPALLAQGAEDAGVSIPIEGPDAPRILEVPLPATGITRAQATGAGGRFALETLRRGIQAIQDGEADALCFAPLNKSALHAGGMRHEDELRWFAELLGHTGPTSEINALEGLWTARVTSHVPLMQVGSLLTPERIVEAVALIHQALRNAGNPAPRIGVCGLNPHNGDGGNFGREEIDIIEPAVALARSRQLPAIGPYPADTIFVRAKRGEFDAIVTMYHDQGQIAMKLMGFDRGVTIAGGLKVPITTPAHGSAYDIVGQGAANTGAIRNAFQIACQMARAAH